MYTIFRTLSAQGDMDTLSEARKFSDLTEPVLSAALKFMGLSLPLDVISLYEVSSDNTLC